MPSGEHESPVALAKLDPAGGGPGALGGVYDHRRRGVSQRLFRNLAAQHEQLGEARGEARAVLTVLEARGVAVPAEVRDQILACTDPAQLETWLRRAGIATAADVIHG